MYLAETHPNHTVYSTLMIDLYIHLRLTLYCGRCFQFMSFADFSVEEVSKDKYRLLT